MTLMVDEQIKKRGYEPITQLFVPNSDLVETASYLANLDINKRMNRIYQMDIEDAIFDTRAFFKAFYRIHNVPYLIRKKFNRYSLRMVNPFDLPIYYENHPDEICYGALITDFTDRWGITFGGIVLNKIVTEFTSCTYAHEITHSLLDSTRGAIREYYNEEVISLVNELILASILESDERILRAEDSRRIFEIDTLCKELQDYHRGAMDKTRDDGLIDSKYLISDVRAYNLFAEYYYGSIAVQRHIVDKINKVMNGEGNVEELLGEFMDIPATNNEGVKLIFSPKTTKYFKRG